MKYLIVIISLIFSMSASSQENNKHINIKYGANSGGFGFGPAVEYKVSNNLTVGALHESHSSASGLVTITTAGYGINSRYYFNEALTQDMYLNTSYVTGSGKVADSFDYVEVDLSSLNFTLGKTWMWGGFNLDGSMGLSYMMSGDVKQSNDLDTSSLEDLDDIGLSISFTVGYAF